MAESNKPAALHLLRSCPFVFPSVCYDLTTCGDPARSASRLNWTSTPPSLSLQPYTPARLGRVQLGYISSWTSFTSATYERFWALHGRTTWLTWRC